MYSKFLMFVLIFITSINIQAYSQNTTDSITDNGKSDDSIIVISQEKKDNTKKSKINTPPANSQNTPVSDEDQIKLLNQQIKQLQDSLQAVNKQHKEDLFELHKILISDASNYLYLPYHEISVEHKAVRSYEATKGSELYNQHIIRLELLKNYKSDIQSLYNFIRQVIPETTKWMSDTRKARGTQEEIRKLKTQSFYIQYSKYNDWQNTWLGSRINRVITILSKSSLSDLEMKQQLKDLNKELEPYIEKEKKKNV